MDFINRAKNTVIKKVSSSNALQNEYLKKLEEDSLSQLLIDYGSLKNLQHEFTSDAFKQNKSRNRYNYEVVDETRVKLPTNIYINANHVSSGPNGINFIAAEGPSGATANEFWTMTFSQNIDTIIMLCQCIESDDIKCFQYFPVSDRKTLESFDIKTIDYHEIIFRHDGKEAKIVERKFQVTNLISHVKKQVVHYQYINWPDHGCPSDTKPLMYLYQIVVAQAMNSCCPILVHCSAGIGRTGVFIAGQFFYELFIKNQLVSMKDGLIKLRKQRNGAIPRQIQYIFLHCLFIDILLVKDSKADREILLKLKEKYFQMLMESLLPHPKLSLLHRMNSAPA